jgi:hypothetical protein
MPVCSETWPVQQAQPLTTAKLKSSLLPLSSGGLPSLSSRAQRSRGGRMASSDRSGLTGFLCQVH